MSAVGQVVDSPTEAIGGHHKAPHQKTKTLYNYNVHTDAKHN